MQLGIRQSSISACSSMCVCVLTYTYTTVCIHATLCVCYSLINLPPSMPPSMPFTPTPSMCNKHLCATRWQRVAKFCAKNFSACGKTMSMTAVKNAFFQGLDMEKRSFWRAQQRSGNTNAYKYLCVCVAASKKLKWLHLIFLKHTKKLTHSLMTWHWLTAVTAAAAVADASGVSDTLNIKGWLSC